MRGNSVDQVTVASFESQARALGNGQVVVSYGCQPTTPMDPPNPYPWKIDPAPYPWKIEPVPPIISPQDMSDAVTAMLKMFSLDAQIKRLEDRIAALEAALIRKERTARKVARKGVKNA